MIFHGRQSRSLNAFARLYSKFIDQFDALNNFLFVNRASFRASLWHGDFRARWLLYGWAQSLAFLETLIHPHRLNSIHLLSRYSQPVVSKRRKGRNASQVWVRILSGRWAWAWRRHPWHPACQQHYKKVVNIRSAFPMQCGERTGRWTGQQQTWRRSWPSQPS